PIASSLAGKGKSSLIPAGLVGTVLTLGADLVAFHAFPVHYPVGVVTGLLGAPYMLYLLIRMNRRGIN
ncbi:iron chelate uptake ABC transporter, FeCT family, permease domain protein, partial [Lachnoanaerobaculum saburreum F0468]